MTGVAPNVYSPHQPGTSFPKFFPPTPLVSVIIYRTMPINYRGIGKYTYKKSRIFDNCFFLRSG